MIPALWVSKTGLEAQQTQVTLIANNLANVNTVGFKRARPVFEDLLYQNIRQPGANSSSDTELPSGLMMGTGVRTVATQKIFAEGSVIHTENPLDTMVNGRGFFQVTMIDGSIGYTRNGQFQINKDGEIVTATGLSLEPAITIPAQAQGVTIAADGTVTVLESGNTTPTNLGQIQIADFINPAGLQAIGENLFRQTASSGDPVVASPGSNGMGSLIQGATEASNVNVVEELVNMIETQRSYEMNSKAMDTSNRMLEFVAQVL